jgi:hypothetical protein
MRSGGSKDANPARTKRSRAASDLDGGKPPVKPTISIPAQGRTGDGSCPADGSAGAGTHAGRHVYTVGGIRISVKGSVRGLENRCAGRVKDFLRKRAESPSVGHLDPTVIEPPIRKPPAPSERTAFHDFSSPPHGRQSGRGRFEPDDDDDEDLDD